jgi:hypothetical protein
LKASPFQLALHTPISIARKLFVYALDLLPQLVVFFVAPLSILFVGLVVKRAGG